MKGWVMPVVVWGTVLVPAVCAILPFPRKVFFAFCAVFGIGMLAVWISFAAYGYRVTENMTTSLNGSVYIHRKGEPFSRGDLVAFRWHGGATYPRGTIFIKRVVGMPGDVIVRKGNEFWVAGQYIGVAKPFTRAGVPLEPASPGVIPPGTFFVATPSVDSLDSRYSLSGNIRQEAIVGRAHALF